MRYLLIILIFASCRSIPIDLPTPEYAYKKAYQDNTAVKDSAAPVQPMPPIVINMPKPEEKEEKVMTAETFRFLVLEVSSLLSTIIAVVAVDSTSP